jgi:hypothetical protein
LYFKASQNSTSFISTPSFHVKMHLSIPFVMTAFLAWQASAGMLYHGVREADLSRVRTGSTHRMIARAMAEKPVTPEFVVPPETEQASPESGNLMDRIKRLSNKTGSLPVQPAKINASSTDDSQESGGFRSFFKSELELKRLQFQ